MGLAGARGGVWVPFFHSKLSGIEMEDVTFGEGVRLSSKSDLEKWSGLQQEEKLLPGHVATYIF